MHLFKRHRPDSRRQRAAILVEALELRSLLSCVLAPDGTLTVEGTNKSDLIQVGIQQTTVDVGADGVANTADDVTADNLVVSLNGSPCAFHPVTDVTKLVINAGNGHDTVTVVDDPLKTEDDVLVPLTIYGGNGKDSLRGGGGNDVIVGGNGKDFIDGAGGDDVLEGGNGKDSIQGGAGNDMLYGGNGPDFLSDSDGNATFDGGRGKDTINGLIEELLAGQKHKHEHL